MYALTRGGCKTALAVLFFSNSALRPSPFTKPFILQEVLHLLMSWHDAAPALGRRVDMRVPSQPFWLLRGLTTSAILSTHVEHGSRPVGLTTAPNTLTLLSRFPIPPFSRTSRHGANPQPDLAEPDAVPEGVREVLQHRRAHREYPSYQTIPRTS